MDFVLQTLSSHTALPPQEAITAVFLVGLVQDRILVTQNERGWDLPGGHLEAGESPVEGLKREALEEAGALFDQAIPFATLGAPASGKAMLFFAADRFRLVELVLSEDVLGRQMMTTDEFLSRYYGDVHLMQTILAIAQQQLYKQSAAGSGQAN